MYKRQILHVPYKSNPNAVTDLLGGQIDFMITDTATGVPQIKGGKLRGLGVSTTKRNPLLPELPTLDEAGVKGFNLDAWAGLVAPARTPPAVVAKLNGALRKVIDSPEVQVKFKNVGFEGFSSTPEELGSYIKEQLAAWGKMVKDANIQIQ